MVVGKDLHRRRRYDRCDSQSSKKKKKKKGIERRKALLKGGKKSIYAGRSPHLAGETRWGPKTGWRAKSWQKRELTSISPNLISRGKPKKSTSTNGKERQRVGGVILVRIPEGVRFLREKWKLIGRHVKPVTGRVQPLGGQLRRKTPIHWGGGDKEKAGGEAHLGTKGSG